MQMRFQVDVGKGIYILVLRANENVENRKQQTGKEIIILTCEHGEALAESMKVLESKPIRASPRISTSRTLQTGAGKCLLEKKWG